MWSTNSFLFDSAKELSKKYQALVVYTLKGLYLIFREQTQNSQAKIILSLIIHATELFKKLM